MFPTRHPHPHHPHTHTRAHFSLGGGSLSEVTANPMELLKTGVPAFLYLVS